MGEGGEHKVCRMSIYASGLRGQDYKSAARGVPQAPARIYLNASGLFVITDALASSTPRNPSVTRIGKHLMRAFDTTAASLALGVRRKWLDNLLSQHQLAGASRDRQGIKRRLEPRAILQIDVALHLLDDLGISLPAALTLAETLLANDGNFAGSRGTELRIDTRQLSRSLADRLAAAAETAPPRRRGRPPRRRASPAAPHPLSFLDASTPDPSELRKA